MTDLETKVASSLETLHKALNNLEPAVEHVQNAMQVTNAAKNVVDQNLKFIDDQNQLNKEHKEEQLKLLNKQAQSITKRSEEVIKGVKKSTDDIRVLDKNFNNYLSEIKAINFPERLSNIDKGIATTSSDVNEIQAKINEIKINLKHVEGEILNHKITILENVKKSNTELKTIDDNLNNYFNSFKKIDFERRLTAIESNVSSTSSAFNNMQNTVSTIQNEIIRLERESTAHIDSMKDELKNNYQVIIEKMELATKENKTLKTIMIVTAVLSLLAIATNFL